MKTTPNENAVETPFISGKNKRFKPYRTLKRKNNIIRNIEIIAAAAIAVLVIVGIYKIL